MHRGPVVLIVSLLCLAISAPAVAQPPAVQESARSIPVAAEVDVVIVGGTTGAVAAAVAAAESGAKVFLAAPRTFLGDDMTATLRLWLEPGEEPTSALAKKLFADKVVEQSLPDPNRIPFRYTADRPSSGVHKDTKPPTLLGDGHWLDPSRESVEFDADVNLVAALDKPQPVQEVRLRAFRRGTTARNAFDVESVAVSVGSDLQNWSEVGAATSQPGTDETVTFSVPVRATTQYVKLSVKKPAGIQRMLLGEIEIIAPPRPDAKPSAPQHRVPRPMHVKKTLDEALIDAKVPFLYSCYATDVLVDAQGNPAGIVMANRAGRQAVVAKTIIDATDRAWVARLSGAKFTAYPTGQRSLRRVVIGGEVQQGTGIQSRTIDPPFRGRFPNQAKTASGVYPVIEYTLDLPVPEDTWAAWAKADQLARSMTYHPDQQFTSDVLFEVPPDSIQGASKSSAATALPGDVPIAAFQPSGVARLYVLGGCADVPRDLAARLLRPLALMDLGARLGKAAATEAQSLATPSGARVRVATASPTPSPAGKQELVPGDVREVLQGVRPFQKSSTVGQDARTLPVLAKYDVVVIGGGTAGAPAGIASARAGAKTLVVEYLSALGGVGTAGAISTYCAGNRVGFTGTVPGGATWIIEQRMEWWRSELLKAGADIWFATVGCGTLVDDQRVTGAVVATPHGRGVVLAKVVVDATGNADTAAAAGAPCAYTDASELAMQGTGLPGRRLGATYTNTDFTIVDETDLIDIWQVFVHAKHKYPDAFDQGQLIDTRERRTIIGDFFMTLLDQVNRRTYEDTICQARGGSYDTHGYTVDPLTIVTHPNTGKLLIDIPYRCLLPKGLDGILVTGLGVSAHRDAIPLIRMQPDIQNLGYATGRAAAMAAQSGTLTRNIDVRQLQEHLQEIGNLRPNVLGQRDSYPMPSEEIAAAVESLKKNFDRAAVIFAHPEPSLPLLRKALADAAPGDKPKFALMLATLGDAAGLEVLAEDVRATPEWDRGWNYKGMGQFGNALSPLDCKIVALGRTRDPRALPVILEKLQTLTATHEFSHHRAAGLALELIADPRAAQPLAALLQKPEMSGYCHPSIEVAIQREAPGGTNAEQTRRESIRELALARALFRCGDHQELGEKILKTYTQDLRGHLARHAQAVLDAGKGQR